MVHGIKKVFLDTNVLLDVVLDREGAARARRIMAMGQIRLYVSFLTMANLSYVIRCRGVADCMACLDSMTRLCNVLPMTESQMWEVLHGQLPADIEDAFQIMCAEEKECDYIVTSNTAHFKEYTDIPVLTPAEFLSHCKGPLPS